MGRKMEEEEEERCRRREQDGGEFSERSHQEFPIEPRLKKMNGVSFLDKSSQFIFQEMMASCHLQIFVLSFTEPRDDRASISVRGVTEQSLTQRGKILKAQTRARKRFTYTVAGWVLSEIQIFQ